MPARKEIQAYQVYLAQRGIVDLLVCPVLGVRLVSDVTAICCLIQMSFYCLAVCYIHSNRLTMLIHWTGLLRDPDYNPGHSTKCYSCLFCAYKLTYLLIYIHTYILTYLRLHSLQPVCSFLCRFRARTVSTLFYVPCNLYGSESRGIKYTFIYKYLYSHGCEDATLQTTINSQEHSTDVTWRSQSLPRAWNRLPSELKTTTCSIETAKRRLKTFFIMDARSASVHVIFYRCFFLIFFMRALVGQTAERIFTKLSHVVDIRCYLRTY